jgi:choline dehydrogenase-like flavoprotein
MRIPRSGALVATTALVLSVGDAVAEAAFDYVIVGGGTCGLVVANRLSENANTTILVLEAGGSVLDNPDVYNPDGYSSAFGTAIDWAYPTTEQTYGDGKVHTIRAGKALGGTSTINGELKLNGMRERMASLRG